MALANRDWEAVAADVQVLDDDRVAERVRGVRCVPAHRA